MTSQTRTIAPEINPQGFAEPTSALVNSGFRALCGVAAYYRIAGDPDHLRRQLALGPQPESMVEVQRAARILGLKARIATEIKPGRLLTLPVPAIVKLRNGGFAVFSARGPAGECRIVDANSKLIRDLSAKQLYDEIEPDILLVTRRIGGEGFNPKTFGFRWFMPSLWRYRRPLVHVLIASLFIQIFGLVTPIFFQIVVDKVLTHKTYSTLYVLTAGLLLIGLFEVVLQYLRTYALSHTTNRIDVELGRRLFHHLLRLPIAYFETRPTGQTVARVRELENVRTFLTGSAMFAGLDFIFTFIFIAVLFAYSWKMTIIVLASIPIYVTVGAFVRPPLRDVIKQKFNRGAESQQFLVESVVGMGTIKASAVESATQRQWEDRLAAYVRTGFEATMLGSFGQNSVQYVSKATTGLILLFGAYAVMAGDMSVGALVAFNMIASQTIAPILRLSQLWQDFQQVQISVERLGDILNSAPEKASPMPVVPPRPRGAIEISHVSFRYSPNSQEVLSDISLKIGAGEVIGIVGASGSGKSTLTRLIQRFYIPEHGQITLDGTDLRQLDPGWLRSHIGVVLQENILFNRTIHENIAFSSPAMPRAQVIALAKLTDADAFISKLPDGYDTILDERGANLSGGQRQRIAIARALATNPPILIFDEATSALDYESERAVQTNMHRIANGRTVIIVAHRLSAVRKCNRIVSFVDGRIVEIGTHDSLLANKDGVYTKLWTLQRDSEDVL